MVATSKLQTQTHPTSRHRLEAPDLEEAKDGQVIRFGMRGDGVKQLQEALVAHKYPLKTDGIFGPKTQAAVLRFQREHGLRVDGLVGPKTAAALMASVKPEDAGAVRTGQAQAPTERERRTGPKEGEVRAGDLARDDSWRRAERSRTGNVVTKPEVVDLPSPNRSSRNGTKVDSIVLHDTGSNNTDGALSWLKNPNSGVSAHYVIGRDGTIYQLVPDNYAAWHAGRSSLHGDRSPSVNARSIGIEIVNDGSGKTPFTDAQYAALEQLVPYLAQKHKVPTDNVVGHKDVAPGRKVDPAPNFDWARIGIDTMLA